MRLQTDTRKMESIFLSSPHHLSVEWAMRRAELLGMGASEQLTTAVGLTRLGSNLDHRDFYRTLIRFLVRFQDDALDASEAALNAIIDHKIALVQLARTENTLLAEYDRRLNARR